ncbi:MAG: XRE family transcriptional regulator [Labilithrix sp.]|nr:XRE family transcriptional regulator [Labilithrix sp.]MCW5816867.1 XRE family transcriptional regulator [Labilithrix sp.]
MDHVDRIVQAIRVKMPRAHVAVERSDNPRGPAWIDVRLDDQAVVVEWRQGMGLGVTSLPTEGLGHAADEVYGSMDDAIERVHTLFETKSKTVVARRAVLAELRSRRRVSQEDLARLLGVSQPNIAKLEKRNDMSIRTLRALIGAIGGRLELIALFGDESVQLIQFEEPQG